MTDADRIKDLEAKNAALIEENRTIKSWAQTQHDEDGKAIKALAEKVAGLTSVLETTAENILRENKFQNGGIMFDSYRLWLEAVESAIRDTAPILAAHDEAVKAEARRPLVEALEKFSKDDLGGCNSCGGIGLHLEDCEIFALSARKRRAGRALDRSSQRIK